MPLRPVVLSVLLTLVALPLFTPMAQAQLTLEATGVTTDASGIIVSTLQTGPISSSNPVTLTIHSGANLAGLVFTGPLGATYLASGPGTAQNSGPGNLINALLDQITNNSGAVRNLTFLVSAVGFTGTPGFDTRLLSGTWLNAAGSSITARWYENPTNQLATITGTLGGTNGAVNLNGSIQVGPQAGPGNTPGSFFTATSNSLQSFNISPAGAPLPSTSPFGMPLPGAPLPSNSPFGMTLEFQLTLTPGANLQNFGQTQVALPGAAVPEPSSVAFLLVSGLGGAGLLLKRCRKK